MGLSILVIIAGVLGAALLLVVVTGRDESR